MPLQVWLPLLGNTDNQGLSDITVVNNGATVDNSGKLGKCYNFGTSTSYLTLSNDAVNKCTTECSLGFWLNIISWNTSYATYFQAGLGGAPWAHYIFGVLRNNAASNLCFTISNGSSASNASYTTSNLDLNTWYHLTFVYKTGHCLIYIDGELYKDYATTIVPNFSGITKTTVGTCNNGSYQTNCKLNDLRIYDHALSPKEVKLLSQGLVAHYQLNDPYSTGNLIPNGFGQDGSLGWSSSSNVSTTEIPSNQSAIKASYFGHNTTTEYIPISQGTTYTISEYIKAYSGATGNVYPSILPYDVDKKFIATYNCPEGFSNTWKTTLAQPLHKGDTIVYATDISNWSTATDNYYDRVAIFGYCDSMGYLYPDMVYTADSLAFGTRTDKSNINKNNNTITLLSAYTGKDRPAGTTICQATEGNTYVYPYGGINVSTISDWTYKTATVSPSVHPRLRSAKYIQYLAYVNAYHAGIQLLDNNANQIVYDSSGYNNHGKIGGSLLSSPDTPRNNISTYFATNSETVTIPAWWSSGQEIDKMSVSIWFKTDTLNSTAPNLWSLGENYFVRIRIASATSVWYYMAGTSGAYSTKTLTDNNWHHIVFVFNSGVVTMYLDSVQIGTTDHSATKPTMIVGNLNWHLAGYTATLEKFIGSLSDFRVYATALSAEDIQSLYNASVSVANNGTMITQGEFVEV